MQKNELIKIYGTDYQAMTKRLLEEARLAELIPGKETRIGIKPNLVTPTPAEYGATTHPEVVSGLIEYLQERGFCNLVILEGAWIGDKTVEAFAYCGYNALSARYHVPLIDLQKDTFHQKDCGGMELRICDAVDAVDFLINVPVLKGHCQTRITCALKNSKGLIPNAEKRRFHTIGLHKPIAHLGVGIPQDFILVDHICGDLDFEEGGNPVVRNCVMAARDPVLVDAYVCQLLHYRVEEVPYVALAEKLGVGCADLTKATISTLGQDLEPETARRSRVLDVQYAVEEVDACSACYAALMPALERLQQEGLLAALDTPIAIGQGCRGQKGGLGVGSCARGYEYGICSDMCPPQTERIYQELRDYLKNLQKNPL